MNIEELKLVLETIRTLSGDASTAAYWYFGLGFAKDIIILFTLVGGAAWGIHKAMQAAGVGADEAFMRECRDALGIGCRGTLVGDERAATQQAIRKLIQESKK
ncbi:hypothetical protein UFOVP189_36 [uncultured Caudovirales phage]|uniref:Uncharacterized protein n=1 Tax=uncultured Caudovirales phage TaxID=2100421 RepID=A0A6J7WIJ8_9CAUD|nr:hypothetical protein UFOVP189_36 [uncultured Caudovirales phage]